MPTYGVLDECNATPKKKITQKPKFEAKSESLSAVKSGKPRKKKVTKDPLISDNEDQLFVSTIKFQK
jgi:hypothetical protein